MKKSMIAVLMAGSLSLGACSTYGNDGTLASAATGAGVGAVAGAGLGAVVGGLSPIQGAAIGAAVGGLAGAVWHDSNNDGYADGYVREGTYYPGTPAGYTATAARANCPTTLGGAATGAAVGAAGGAGVGALVGGLSPLAGAAIGAVVGGVAGAVWADNNNDGCVDGYVREGTYYQGAPTYQQQQPVRRSGERG